jgi:hypothetical protein
LFIIFLEHLLQYGVVDGVLLITKRGEPVFSQGKLCSVSQVCQMIPNDATLNSSKIILIKQLVLCLILRIVLLQKCTEQFIRVFNASTMEQGTAFIRLIGYN